jgi:hypothetical protein
MSEPENLHGRPRRFDFICAIVDATQPRAILGIGCGVDIGLTLPRDDAIAHIDIIGVDEDARSLAVERAHSAADSLTSAVHGIRANWGERLNERRWRMA